MFLFQPGSCLPKCCPKCCLGACRKPPCSLPLALAALVLLRGPHLQMPDATGMYNKNLCFHLPLVLAQTTQSKYPSISISSI